MFRLAIPLLIAMAALVTIPATTPGEAMLQPVIDCPNTATGYRNTPGGATCRCGARATRSGTVWGTDTYTDDSNICRAAVHAGAITPSGGNVRIIFMRGQRSYQGSTRNGVQSRNYGSWDYSYRFFGAAGDMGGRPDWNGDRVEACPNDATSLRGRDRSLQCRCSASDTRSGTVWGSDIYTDDSNICRAARHAGVIGARGGVVTLWTRPGRSSYSGSYRNGVETRNYGRWSGSFEFGRGGAARPPYPGGPAPLPTPEYGGSDRNCPGNGYALRAQSGPLTCTCTRTGVSAGAIYGTGYYSERSAICRAALHAGAVGTNGGVITVYPAGGRRIFLGSSRNGVQSQQAGPADYSFRFNR